MQNKPNLQNDETSASASITKDYEILRLYSRCKNKPNQTQFQAQNWLCFSPKIAVKWLAENIFLCLPCALSGVAQAKTEALSKADALCGERKLC
jgi:hypothetical protein